jgi:hypothetical protein
MDSYRVTGESSQKERLDWTGEVRGWQMEELALFSRKLKMVSTDLSAKIITSSDWL